MLQSILQKFNFNRSNPTPQPFVDYRTLLVQKLTGSGIELGPLHRPLVKKNQQQGALQVQYVDLYTREHLRQVYPELNSEEIVETDIIDSAETLQTLPSGQFDFVVSSHVIEHMKNPIASLQNWFRLLRPGGLLYLIVPDKRLTFDIQRPRTTLEHMIMDYYKPSVERDFEHYVDFSFFVGHHLGVVALQGADDLIRRNYSIHFHVFIPEDVIHLLDWFSKNIEPITILEGPYQNPGSEEFHFLIQK